MESAGAKQVLSNLYGLMMEINLRRSDEDVLVDLQANPDPHIEKHLVRVKQLNAKLKALATQTRFQQAMEQPQLLKEKGIEELQKLLAPQEQIQLQPLFRKFEELTADDEAAILEDQDLLHLIEVLQKKVDDNPKL